MPAKKVASLDPLFANRISLIHNGQAGQGAGRGPGVRPTIFAGRPVIGKTSGGRLAACPARITMWATDAISFPSRDQKKTQALPAVATGNVDDRAVSPPCA